MAFVQINHSYDVQIKVLILVLSHAKYEASTFLYTIHKDIDILTCVILIFKNLTLTVLDEPIALPIIRSR